MPISADRSEGASNQRQRPARGFATGPRHLVVGVGVLELREVELERLVENHDVHGVPELGAKQEARHLEALLGRSNRDHEHELGADPRDGRVAVGR